jgi:RNA polymerase sigma-70 factor (ECF subfamily)
MKFLRSFELPPHFRSEEQLVAELYRQMLKVARYKLRNKNEATDIVQEAWVRILEHRHTLRESAKLIPWAKRIASNLASNANRASRTQPIHDELTQNVLSQESLSCPELMAELSDMLGRMEPEARTLMLYKFYYGFKDDEIAAALSLPVGTIKARIHRHKARLKK